MRKLAIFIVLFAVAALAMGCGSTSNTDVTGNWSGTTTSTQGGQSLTFTFAMQEGATNGNTIPVTFSNLAFSTQNNCFDNTASITGAITPGNPRTMAVDVFSGVNNTGNHAAITLTIAADNNSAAGTQPSEGYVLVGGTGGCVNDLGNVTFTRQ